MRRLAAVTAGSIAAAGTLAWAVPNLAQAESTPSTPPSASSSTPVGPEGWDDRRAEMQAELADRLAEELGIDADKVAAALEKVSSELRAEHEAERLAHLKERLATAVEKGRLTQERADEILEAAEDGDLRGMMRGGRHGGHGFGPGGRFGFGGPWANGPDVGADEGTDSGTSSTTSFSF